MPWKSIYLTSNDGKLLLNRSYKYILAKFLVFYSRLIIKDFLKILYIILTYFKTYGKLIGSCIVRIDLHTEFQCRFTPRYHF